MGKGSGDHETRPALALGGRGGPRYAVMYHGSPSPQLKPRVRRATDEDEQLPRLVGFYTSSDPGDAARFGPVVHSVPVSLQNPFVLRLPAGTPGDPGMEVYEALTGQLPPERVDVAAAVRSAGHDGVWIEWSDGRVWGVALTDDAFR